MSYGSRSRPVRLDLPPIASTPRLLSSDEERLRFIHQRLDSGRFNAEAWWIGWLAGFSTVAVVEGGAAWRLQGAQYTTLRPQLVIGAISATIGAVGVLVMPWPGTWATNPSDNLPSAEHRLKLIADSELLGHSWMAHVAALIVNGAGALIMGLAFHLRVDALLNFAVGMAVAEAQIFTHPSVGIQDDADYREWRPAMTADWAIHF